MNKLFERQTRLTPVSANFSISLPERTANAQLLRSKTIYPNNVDYYYLPVYPNYDRSRSPTLLITFKLLPMCPVSTAADQQGTRITGLFAIFIRTEPSRAGKKKHEKKRERGVKKKEKKMQIRSKRQLLIERGTRASVTGCESMKRGPVL